MIGTEPTIDHVLTAFFNDRKDGVTGLRRRRIDGVERRLRECLEREGHHVLCDDCRVLLELERQFGSAGAFARTMYADALLLLLRRFIDPPWLPPDPQDRRVQLRLADALAAYLDAHRLFDRRAYAIPFLELQCSILQAREALR
jgi:hypothetical protein